MQFQLNKLMLAAALLVLAGVVTPLFIFKPWQRPSGEMSLLRGVENKLSLPEAAERVENDAGYYKDKDGASHNVRRITNFYDDAAPVKKTATAVVGKGWAARPTVSVDGKTSTVLVNMMERSCIELRTAADGAEAETDGSANRVVIMSESDDSCSGYLALIL